MFSNYPRSAVAINLIVGLTHLAIVCWLAHGRALLPRNIYALDFRNLLTNLEREMITSQDFETLSRPTTDLSVDVPAVLGGHLATHGVGHLLAHLPGHLGAHLLRLLLALLPGHLARYGVTLLLGHLGALLPGDLFALLPLHLVTLLPGDFPETRGQLLGCVTSTR